MLSLVDPLSAIPPPAARRLALHVTPAAQRALRQGHPWLFDQSITQQRDEGHPGDLAVVFDERRQFLAIGLYDPTSSLRVRILQHTTPQPIDQAWLREKLTQAKAVRAGLPAQGTTGYRLVHGENDGLPGLVIDRYAGVLVLKLYSVAWVPWLRDLRSVLAEVQPADAVVLRLSRAVQRQPEALFGLVDGITLAGETIGDGALFSENGLHFEANVRQGQKTGFFLDQRENRARVEKLAAERTTLNVFAYSGGFSLYAARGGAVAVVSLDLSAPALAAAQRNFALNQHIPAVAVAQHDVLVADAFVALADLRRARRRFDLVIVDPPAMAKQSSEIARARLAYSRLTGLALGVLTPGGTLVMSSCSSRVDADTFFATINQAARQAGRPLRERERTGHPIDHPVRFPEGAYLKCLFAEA